MTEVRRIDPETGFIREFKDIAARVGSLETKPSGNIVIRETLTATDPETGVKTIIGQLPDGTVGFQPFVGDIVPPPVATAPVASAQPGNITISWDGEFVGGAEKPNDFQHVNVKAHKIMDGSTVLTLTVGVIRLATEQVIVTTDVLSYGETWEFSLESEDYNGNRAALSARSASVGVLSNVDDSQVGEALADLAAAAQAAQEAADAAQGAASSAQDDADAAAASALAAANLAGSKGVIYTQSATPSGDYSGLWIDTAHNNIPRRFLGVRSALVMNVGGGASIGTRLTSLGWAVSAITTTPSVADASKYDLVAMDAGYAGLLTGPRDLATQLWTRGVSLITTGNDTTAMPPLFSGAVNRGTPKNVIRYVSAGSDGPSAYADYTDTDLNLYLTGVNAAAKVTGVTLAASTSTDQPINLIMEHPTNFARWAHVETYGTPSAVLNAHLAWISNNWVAIQDQGIIDAAAAAGAAQIKADQAFNNAATAATAAGNAQTTANGRGRLWYQDDQPAGIGHNVGDTWFDTNDNYKQRTWNGSIWQTTQDSWKAQQTADSKGITYTQDTVPPVEARLPQNLWNDTSLGLDKVVTKYWSTTANAWTPIADKAATEARTVADSKGETIYSDTEPTVAQRLPQNLWIDTTGGININKRWNGSGWVVVVDARIPATASAVTAADSKAQDAYNEALAKSVIYTQDTTPPVSARLPQTIWNDTSLGLNNIVVKYWNGSGWTPIVDKAATDAQTVAESKGETIYSDTEPAVSKRLPQNLWIDTTNGMNFNKRWNGTSWVIVTDARIATTSTAVTAAQKSADDALASAAAKSVVYTQSTTPPVEARLPQTIWNDTSLGLDKIVVKFWDGGQWAATADKVATEAAAVVAGKTKTWFQPGTPPLTGNTTGDLWIDTDDNNKIYVWNGAWTVAQDSTINKSIFATFSSDIDNTAPNKWLFTRYNKSGLVNNVAPTYLDILGVAGTSTLVADAASLVNSVGDNYVGQLRTVVNVASSKTISITASHDDGAAIYVDGVSVYSKNTVTNGAAISFALTAGWHVLDFLWIEVTGSDGWFNISPTIGSQVTSMFAPVSLTSVSQAVSAAQTSANAAQTSADTAMKAQQYSLNASFDDWTGATPALSTAFTTAPTKETTIVRRAPFAARWNLTDTTTQAGLTFATNSILAHAPNLEYFTVEVDLYLVSGGLGGSGMILDWSGMTNNRAQINFASEITAPVTGKWYTISKTLRRPTNATGTWTGMSGYLMAQWSGHGAGATKNIIFDWFNVRPATSEEILSYNAPADATTKANNAQTAAIAAAATDATTKATNAQTAAISAAASDATTKANAAQQAAIDAAAADATAKAEQAEADAAATAAADATAKANAAKQAAIDAAAVTAQLKADNAEQAAIDAAAADAQAKADAAEAAAIAAAAADATAKSEAAEAAAAATAAADATAKANAAQAAAISAAAADAQTKADSAQAAAVAAAALDATAKADAAKAAALTAAQNAENKVVNGSFELDFDGWTKSNNSHSIDSTVARSGAKSYVTQGGGEITQPGFPVVVGTVWRYEWFYKTEASFVPGSAGGLRLQKSSDNGATWSDATSSGLSVQSNWTYQNVEYTVPAGVTHLRARIAFAYPAGPKAWMDDVRLIDVTQIKTLEADATTKANAAQAAAIAAAASDATAKANAAQAAAVTAADAAAKVKFDQVWASARSYVNPAMTVDGVATRQGIVPSTVVSASAMGGTALRKTGSGHGWWEDTNALQAYDPTALYRFTIRVRITTPATAGGTGFYWGLVGLAADKTTYVNAAGANSFSSQQWVIQNSKPATDGTWVDYVVYYKGISTTTPSGAGTVLDPRTVHTNTRYFQPGMILDYASGNGVWEVSHWSVDVVDAAGHQALVDATNKSATAKAEAIAAAASDATTKANNAQAAAVAAAALDATTKANQAKADAIAAATTADKIPGKWIYSFLDDYVSATPPAPSDFAVPGVVRTLVTDAATLVQNASETYRGSLRTMVRVASSKTISVTATHDDGGAIYLDGTRVYNATVYTQNKPISLTLSAGWHMLELTWTENSGGDGWYGINPIFSSLVDELAAPSGASSAQWDAAQVQAAAAADATTKANNAQTAAIAAAATDAQTKANAAQAAAVAAASADATSKADAAEAAAIAAAELDAQAKAATAQQAAIDAAAADAQAKADAAEQAAIDAAALTAQLMADGAEQSAIDAAAADAATKAATAQQAAIDAAALDASAKATQAKTDAITAAASDAQTRATAAKTEAIEAAANDATNKADLAQRIAIQAGAYSLNPSFEDWTGTLPASYGTFNTVPTKETTTVRTGKFAMRFNCTDTTTQRGVTLHSTLAHAPNLEYFTLELDVRLDSGTTFAGSGVLLDWLGLTNNRVTVSLATEIPTPVAGKWYRVTKVLRRPTNATGTWTAMNGWLMGQYSSGMGTMSVKNVIFDWINIRPSTTEEITAYGTPASISATNASVSALSDTVNTKTKSWFQTNQPPTTGNTAGDLWFDTDDNNKIYVWVGSPTNAWTVASDQRIESLNTAVSAAQTSANGKNKIIWSTADASGTSGYVAGDTWFKKDASGTILAQWEFTTSWQSRTLNEAIIPNLSAGKIVTGTLGADRIGANTITASKLTVSDPEELIPNPFFHPSGEPVLAAAGTVISTASSEVSGGSPQAAPYPYAIQISNRDNHPFATANIAVKPGDQFYIEAWVRAASTTTRQFNFYIFGSNSPIGGLTAKDNLSINAADAKTSWVLHKWHYTVPLGATYNYIKPVLQVNNVGGDAASLLTWYVTGWSMRRKNTGLLIVDGAIKANSAIIEEGAIGNAHIGFAAVDTAEIKALAVKTAQIDDLAVTDAKITSLNAGKISAGYLNAAVIAAGSIKADKLDVTMGGNNLVANSSFEVDSDNNGLADGWLVWTRGTGDAGRVFTNTRPAGLFPGSSFAQRVTSTTVTTTEASSLQAITPFDVAAGDIVTLSIYGRASVAGNYSISMRCEDGTGAYKGDAGFTAAFTTVTDRYEGTVTIPAGTTRAKVTLTTPTVLPNGHWFEVDGVKAELGDISSAWSPMTSELLPGTINATMLTATAIDGKTITGATIQTETTANRGIKLTTSEFAGYDTAGVKNFSLTSAGALSLKGSLTSGSTITGATVTGSTIQTEVTANRGIKLTTSELAGYDGAGVKNFSLSTGGSLAIRGSIDSSTITGSTVTGSTIQTETTANRGIKLTTDELTGYDTSGVKNFSLTSAGALSIKGEIKSGSVITGATLAASGGGIETTTAVNRGVKLKDTGIVTYDGSGNMTFKVDASTGIVEAPGLKANSITGDKIAAKTIDVSKLTISDFSNYVENPSFETGDLMGWDVVGGWTVNTAAPHTGTYKALVAYNGTTQSITNKAEVTLPAGGKVRVKFRIYSEQPSVSGTQAVLALYNVVGGALESVTNITQTGQWVEIDRELTAATAGAKRLQIATTGAGSGYLRVDSIVMNRMMNGELIVDGAMDAKSITGATITGGLIQSEATLNRGIKMTSSELTGYDNAGVKNFALTSLGALSIRGSIESGSTIKGATLSAAGGGIETTTATNRGVKIKDTGIWAYDSLGNMTFKVDASTGIVEAPGIKANSITGDQIAGQTISAKNLFVGDFANLATIDELNGITVTSYGQTQIVGGYNKLVTDSGSFFMFTDQRGPVPFELNDTLYFDFVAKATSATTAQFAVWTYNTGVTATTLGPTFNIGTIDTPIKLEVKITQIAADAKTFVLGLNGVANKGIQVKKVHVYKKFGGSLIVDGAIDGKVITGATIQSDSTPVSAPRGIKFNSTEFAGYDAAGVKNFSLTSAGALTLKGAIQSGSSIIGATLSAGGGGIETTTTPLRGVKLKDTGITTYDNSGNMTFKVDAATGLVEAPGIKANSIKGDKIESGTVTADKLLVTGANIHTDPGFKDASGWMLDSGVTLSATGGRGSAGSLNIAQSSTQIGGYYASIVPAKRFAVKSGGFYRASVLVKGSANIPVGGVSIYFRTYTADDAMTWATPMAISNDTVITAGVWTEVSGTFEIPATSVAGAIGLYKNTAYTTGTVTFSDVFVQQAASGVLIVDGAIKTNHMTSDSIDGGVITAGSLAATKIQAKSIGVDRLTISSSDNLIVEAAFEHPQTPGSSWTRGATQIMQPTGGRFGTPALRLTGTTSVNTSYNLNNKVVVDQDSRFRVSMWVKTNVLYGNGAIRLGVRPYSGATAGAETTLFSNSSNAASANYVAGNDTYTLIEGVTNPLPANTTAVDFYVSASAPSASAYVDIDSLSVTRASTGKLIVDGSITADKLETELVLATRIVAGDPDGTFAEMSPQGFRVYADALEPGAPSQEVVRLGVAATNDYFAVTKADGSVAATISDGGVGSFAKLSVPAYDASTETNSAITGLPEYGTGKGGLWYAGEEFQTHLNQGRLIARAYRNTSSAYNAASGQNQPYCRLDRVFLKKGNLYRISTGPVRMDHDSGTQGYMTIWWKSSTTDSNVQATIGGTSVAIAETVSDSGPVRTSDASLGLVAPEEDCWASFLFSFSSQGPGQVGIRSSSAAPFRMLVENLGRDIGTSGINLDGTNPPPPAVNTYQKQYTSAGIRSFDGNNNFYNFDTGHMYQGLSPAGYGNLKSISIQNNMTSDLSGSTINWMRVYFYFDHWYYNSGGTARVGVHGWTSLPSSFNGTGSATFSAGGIPKPGDRWISIPSNHWDGFKTGALRGVFLEGDNTYGTYGYARPPVIEVNYTK